MINFEFSNTTEIVFGKGTQEQVGEKIRKYSVPYTQEKKVPAKEQNRMVLAVKNVKHSIYVAWKKE